MFSRLIFKRACIVLLLPLFFSCTKSITYTYWRVASQRYTIEHTYSETEGQEYTITFQDVLLIKNLGEDQASNPPWVMRDHLDGFDFEPGYECVLKVRYIWGKEGENGPDDWGRRLTTIVSVISKEQKETAVDLDDINYREGGQMGYAL